MQARIIPDLTTKDILRLVSSVDFVSTKQCWPWNKTKTDQGYGSFFLKRKEYLAHRVSYEFFRKVKIDTNMVIDHLCMNKICVNPNHLEVVTPSENNRRAVISKFGNLCAKGHLLAGSNVWIRTSKRGKEVSNRVCKKCRAERMRTLRAERKTK